MIEGSFSLPMLAALETQARELGFRTLRLETNKTLREAIALYRSAGYREVASFNDEPRHSDCSSEFAIPPGPEVARALLL